MGFVNTHLLKTHSFHLYVAHVQRLCCPAAWAASCVSVCQLQVENWKRILLISWYLIILFYSVMISISICENEYAAVGTWRAASTATRQWIHRNIHMSLYMRTSAITSRLSLPFYIPCGVFNEVL